MSDSVKDRFWTVRNMPAHIAAQASAAAKRADKSVAEWVAEAIAEKLLAEREEIAGEVLPPTPSREGRGLVSGGDLPGGLLPGEILAYLNAYRAVVEMRSKTLRPNDRVLLAAQRMLRAPFVELAGQGIAKRDS